MAKGNKTPAGRPRLIELERENAVLRTRFDDLQNSRRSSNVSSILKLLIRFAIGGSVIVLCVDDLAGKSTTLDAALDLCTSLTDALQEIAPNWAAQIIAFLVSLTAWVAVRRYSRLVKTLNTRVGKLTVEMESKQDPNRTSSGLEKGGQTHGRDKT